MKLIGHINKDIEIYKSKDFYYILNDFNKYIKLGHTSYIAFYIRNNEVSFGMIN